MFLNAYTFSDVHLVTQILSQIAMIFDGGAFDVAAKAAAIVGLIVALFTGIFKGGQFSMATFFWPVMVAVLMIMPKVDLVIEDKNGGISRVDDLPIGFAAPISIITMLGAGVSDMLTGNLGLDDTAVTMDNGHLLALRAPVVYRQIITDKQFQGTAAVFSNGLSPTEDTKRYIGRCIVTDGKQGGPERSFSNIQSRDFSTYRVNGAGTSVATSNGGAYDCAPLYDALMAGFRSPEYQNALNQSVNKFFSKYKNDTTTGQRYEAALRTDVSDPANFYAAVAWAHAIEESPADFIAAAGGGAHQAALNDALSQRREKNYGTAAVIFETIATTISFIEVWSLSIMPLVLLLMMIGPIGSKTAVKYFWMLVWVQFWYPTLLIVMGFLDASLQAAGLGTFISVAAVNSFMAEVMRLQDVGYLYLSMGTALSMFLVFGTSSALASSMQRDMTGSDHVDPKKTAPDTFSRGPLNLVQSERSMPSSGNGIGIATDAGMLGNVRISVGHTVGSTHTASEAAAFAGGVTYSAGNALSETSSLGNGITTSTTNTTGAQNSVANTGQKSFTTSEQVNSQNQSTYGIESISDGVLAHRLGGTTNLGGSFDLGKWLGSGTKKPVRDAPSADEAKNEQGRDDKASPLRFAAGVDASMHYSASDRYATSQRDSSQVGFARSVTNSDNGSVTGTATKTDGFNLAKNKSQSFAETTSQTDSQSRLETASSTSTQADTKSDSAITSKTASQDFLLHEVAAVMANNPNAMAMTKQAVIDARLNSEVDAFMNENAKQLEHLYKYGNADEARYAFAAHYVMQDMDNRLYADDVENGEKRREAINAVSDDIVRYTGLGQTGAPAVTGRVTLDNLANAEQVDPGAIKSEFSTGSAKYKLDEEVVATALNGVNPTMGDPAQVLDAMSKKMGVPFENMTNGQANGVATALRESLDDHYGPISSGKQSMIETLREKSFASAIYEGILGGEDDRIARSAMSMRYDGLADQTGIGYPDHTTGTQEEVSAKASAILDGYLKEEVEKGTFGQASNVARYMSLSALFAASSDAGDERISGQFGQMLYDMENADPRLQDPDLKATLQGLGTNGYTGREYLRGEAEYDLHGFMEEFQSRTGYQNIVSDGSEVSWSDRPAAPGRNNQSGGATTLPSGSGADMLLTFIGSFEAPRGYDQFEGASANNPPPAPLTEMTIGEVMTWQDGRIRGQETRAAGQYQMTGGSEEDKTFQRTLRSAGLSEDDLFSPESQDRLALALVEQAGYSQFMAGKMSTEDFGANLASTWAALPKMKGQNPDHSAYQGLQGNKGLVSAAVFGGFLERIREVD